MMEPIPPNTSQATVPLITSDEEFPQLGTVATSPKAITRQEPKLDKAAQAITNSSDSGSTNQLAAELVASSSPKSKSKPCNNEFLVFIGGLRESMSDDSIKSTLSQFGNITTLVRKTGNSVAVASGTQYGFLGFSTQEEATAALKAGEVVVGDIKLSIKLKKESKPRKMATTGKVPGFHQGPVHKPNNSQPGQELVAHMHEPSSRFLLAEGIPLKTSYNYISSLFGKDQVYAIRFLSKHYRNVAHRSAIIVMKSLFGSTQAIKKLNTLKWKKHALSVRYLEHRDAEMLLPTDQIWLANISSPMLRFDPVQANARLRGELLHLQHNNGHDGAVIAAPMIPKQSYGYNPPYPHPGARPPMGFVPMDAKYYPIPESMIYQHGMAFAPMLCSDPRFMGQPFLARGPFYQESISFQTQYGQAQPLVSEFGNPNHPIHQHHDQPDAYIQPEEVVTDLEGYRLSPSGDDAFYPGSDTSKENHDHLSPITEPKTVTPVDAQEKPSYLLPEVPPAPGPPADPTNLYVKNLSDEVFFGPEDLQKVFEKFGKITSVNLPTYEETKAIRGFGMVKFEKAEAALTAMNELQGTLHGQKRIFVTYYEPVERREKRLQEIYAKAYSVEARRGSLKNSDSNTQEVDSSYNLDNKIEAAEAPKVIDTVEAIDGVKTKDANTEKKLAGAQDRVVAEPEKIEVTETDANAMVTIETVPAEENVNTETDKLLKAEVNEILHQTIAADEIFDIDAPSVNTSITNSHSLSSKEAQKLSGNAQQLDNVAVTEQDVNHGDELKPEVASKEEVEIIDIEKSISPKQSTLSEIDSKEVQPAKAFAQSKKFGSMTTAEMIVRRLENMKQAGQKISYDAGKPDNGKCKSFENKNRQGKQYDKAVKNGHLFRAGHNRFEQLAEPIKSMEIDQQDSTEEFIEPTVEVDKKHIHDSGIDNKLLDELPLTENVSTKSTTFESSFCEKLADIIPVTVEKAPETTGMSSIEETPSVKQMGGATETIADNFVKDAQIVEELGFSKDPDNITDSVAPSTAEVEAPLVEASVKEKIIYSNVDEHKKESAVAPLSAKSSKKNKRKKKVAVQPAVPNTFHAPKVSSIITTNEISAPFTELRKGPEVDEAQQQGLEKIVVNLPDNVDKKPIMQKAKADERKNFDAVTIIESDLISEIYHDPTPIVKLPIEKSHIRIFEDDENIVLRSPVLDICRNINTAHSPMVKGHVVIPLSTRNTNLHDGNIVPAVPDAIFNLKTGKFAGFRRYISNSANSLRF